VLACARGDALTHYFHQIPSSARALALSLASPCSLVDGEEGALSGESLSLATSDEEEKGGKELSL